MRRSVPTTVLFSGARGRVGMNQIPPEVDAVILDLLSKGKSVRQVAVEAGVHMTTVLRRMKPRAPQVVSRRSGASLCDYCGKRIEKEREFHRRTRRTIHKFCDMWCYGAFYRDQRQDQKCVRCGIRRGDVPNGTLWTRGMCPRCYYLLRVFGFDESLAAAHEELQELRREINHGKRIDNQEHGRPAEDAD